MARKSANEKLNNHKGFEIIDISDQPDAVSRYGGSKMLIAAPLEYNEIIAKIPSGKVITSVEIRDFLAKKHSADFTCPLTAGIFINLVAHADVERDTDKVPFWRTLKTKGELNEKYPGGIEAQKDLLKQEGHEILVHGKRCFVKDYDKNLWLP